MRISDVVSMGKEYLILGILMVVLFVAVVLAGYFLVYKKLMRGRKTLTIAGVVKAGVLVCYLTVVLGATLLRGAGGGFHLRLQMFASYKEAWVHASPSEWRNLVLNILMFVPMGIWLPIMGGCFRKFWCTYLAGFGFSLLIEMIQLVSGRGVAEADDILNNTLGAMIGFGLYALAVTLWKRRRYPGKWRKRERNKNCPLWPAILLQIPLLLVCAGFGMCALIYYVQPYGNLPSAYISPVNMEHVELIKTGNYSQTAGTAGIYQADIASREETDKTAEAVFAKLGTQIDKERTDFYDSTAWYYSVDGKYILIISYTGQKTDLTCYDVMELKGKSGCSQEEIRSALTEYGIEIPENVVFADNGDGNYQFKVSMVKQGELLIDGELDCCYAENDVFFEIRNNIVTYEKRDTVDIISPAEALKKVEEGEFQSYGSLDKLELESVELSYELDSKGFYRPVYVFHAQIDGEEDRILISAQK